MKEQREKNGNEKQDRDPSRDIHKDYDPYQKDPGTGRQDDERVEEADERDARQREGVQMQGTTRLDDSTTSPVIHTGQAGQTTRGSYGADPSTGQGTYMERTGNGAADVGVEPIDPTSARSQDTELGDADLTNEKGGKA